MHLSTPTAPQLPTFSNDGRSTAWKLDGFQVTGPFIQCTWRRMTSLPLLLEPSIDPASNLPKLAPGLQLGRPQLLEDSIAPDSTEAADLELLAGRMIPLAVAPSAAPPAPPAAPLPHWARERSPMPTQRNVALYGGGQAIDSSIPFDVTVRPSAVDPSLLVAVDVPPPAELAAPAPDAAPGGAE